VSALFTQCLDNTVQTGTGKVDPDWKFISTTVARDKFIIFFLSAPEPKPAERSDPPPPSDMKHAPPPPSDMKHAPPPPHDMKPAPPHEER